MDVAPFVVDCTAPPLNEGVAAMPGLPRPTKPSLNGLAAISLLPACTPPNSMLNDPAPVAEPTAMSNTVISVLSRREIGQLTLVPSTVLARASAVRLGTLATVSR